MSCKSWATLFYSIINNNNLGFILTSAIALRKPENRGAGKKKNHRPSELYSISARCLMGEGRLTPMMSSGGGVKSEMEAKFKCVGIGKIKRYNADKS